jgi:hypothetical protein
MTFEVGGDALHEFTNFLDCEYLWQTWEVGRPALQRASALKEFWYLSLTDCSSPILGQDHQAFVGRDDQPPKDYPFVTRISPLVSPPPSPRTFARISIFVPGVMPLSATCQTLSTFSAPVRP